MIVDDCSSLPFVHRVEALEKEQSISAEDLATRFSNRPVLLKGTATEAGEADWSEVFEAIGNLVCPVSLELDFAGSTYIFKSSMRFRDFRCELERRDGMYLSEWYLFTVAPELVSELTKELPPALLNDYLDLLPPSWRYLQSPTRTNLWYGSTGSRTNLHIDSINTCTWSMCLQGVKRWLLLGCQDEAASMPRCGGAGFDLYQSLTGGVSASTFVTPEALNICYEAMSQRRGKQLPEIYVVDVEPGSTLYLPWGWAHQVQNIGVTLSVSRYYVGAQNLAAFLQGCRSLLGHVGPGVLAVLLSSARGRQLLTQRFVQSLLSRPLLSRISRKMLKLGCRVPDNHHWFMDARSSAR